MNPSHRNLTGIATKPSLFLTNFRSLKQLLTRPGTSSRSMRQNRPVERLDEYQLDQVIAELETGRYRINPENWYRLHDQRYHLQMLEFSNRLMRNARTADENRYDEENEPTPPSCVRISHGYSGQVVCLEDGRLAKRIDQTRAMALCGVRTPLVLSEREQRANRHDGISLVRWITGSVQCSRCQGYHLSPVESVPTPESSVELSGPEIVCPHCHGTSLDVTRDGMVLNIHCLCGWYAFRSLLNLEADVVAQNTRSVLAAPVCDVEDEEEVLDLTTEWTGIAERRVDNEPEWMNEEQSDESEEGDLVEALVGMTEDTESSRDSDDRSADESVQRLQEAEVMEETEALLIRSVVGLWSSREQLTLRRLLLDRTMCGVLTASTETSASIDRLALIWTVAAILTESVSRLSGREQHEFVEWLVESSDAELRAFLPEDLQDMALPNVYVKIRSWMRSCAQRVQSFRSRAAGIRFLAPKFGVSERAFETAVALTV